MDEQDPMTHPAITIGGKTYELKIRCGTIIRLKKLDVDLFEQPPEDPRLREQWKSPLERGDVWDRVEVLARIISVCVSTKEHPVTPDDILDTLELNRMTELFEAVGAALKKALAQIVPPAAENNEPTKS